MKEEQKVESSRRITEKSGWQLKGQNKKTKISNTEVKGLLNKNKKYIKYFKDVEDCSIHIQLENHGQKS